MYIYLVFVFLGGRERVKRRALDIDTFHHCLPVYAVCDWMHRPLTRLLLQSRLGGQTTPIPSALSPKRDCGSKRVEAWAHQEEGCS